MARRRRPSYSPEFKAEAIRLVRTSPDSVAKIAREVGVSAWTLRHWINETRPAAALELTADERTELTQLRREVRQLREERDILKKATAFFAKHGG
jgi:transposase